jgi:signal transduction histidine kinase
MIKVATISLWNYAALVINVIAFAILYMKANKNASLIAFFRVQISMIIWLVGKIFKTVSPNVDLRWAFIVFYYFGIDFLSASFLDFAYIYYKGKPMNKLLRFLIYAISMTNFLIVFTNPYHYRFYSRYSFFGDDFGDLFILQVFFNYLFILIGLIFCTIRFREQLHDKDKAERHLIGFAILAPLVFNVIYITRTLEAVFDYFGIQVFDITPIIYTWSIVIFVYATFRYEFFELTPIMKHEITSRLRTPVLVTDEKYQTLYSNKQFRRVFPNPDDVIYHIINEEYEEHEVIEVNGKYYKYVLNEINKIGSAKYILTLNDVTSYHQTNELLLAENQGLKAANEKLEDQIELLKVTSHMGARNFVARELHDIVGHSLVLSMKLLEVSKISLKKNSEKAIYSLESAKDVLASGMEDIRTVREKESGLVFNSESLEKEIRSVLKSVDVSGMNTSFFMRGSCNQIDEILFDVLKKISKELVTNTLKHARATTLLLSISFEDDSLRVNYMDNGRGMRELVKGNGLNGIDSRLDLVDGQIKYELDEGNGFNAHIFIPHVCKKL